MTTAVFIVVFLVVTFTPCVIGFRTMKDDEWYLVVFIVSLLVGTFLFGHNGWW